MINWSEFGKKLTSRSGILELMDDLGKAMQAPGKLYMLGGGNPASIPEVSAVWRRRMEEILANGREFEDGLGNYDRPQGKDLFLDSLVDMLNREYGWNLKRQNIAVTNGSQSAFFMLFNLLSGEIDSGRGEGDGTRRHGARAETNSHILLPLMPEYIGYADQGIGHEHFRSLKPEIELLDDHYFKYHVDFSRLEVGPGTAALCVSRPTNPTGNVLSDEEIDRLDRLATKHSIPLIIDNAYGLPFPGIIFTEARPVWNENIILSLSLSKLGLPSTRTGIIIAREEIIEAVSAVNAIVSLANGTLGQMITRPLIDSGELLRLSSSIIAPYYREKSLYAQEAVHRHFKGLPYRIHLSQGSLFLWLWFDHPLMDSRQLYERLKKRQTIIVPGSYFFFGLDDSWDHSRQCIRINFAGERDMVDEGIRRIAEELSGMLS